MRLSRSLAIATLSAGMAVALITTLYGAMIANMVTGPLGDKLQARDAEERAGADALAQRMGALDISIECRVGENNVMYGSVTSADIAQALAAGQYLTRVLAPCAVSVLPAVWTSA